MNGNIEYEVFFVKHNGNIENTTKVVKRNFVFIMVIVAVLALGNLGIGLLMISTEMTFAEQKELWNESTSSANGALLIGYGVAGIFWKVLMFFLAIYTALLGVPACIGKSIFEKTPESILAYRVLMAVVYFFLIIPELFLLFLVIMAGQVLGILLSISLIGATIYSMVNTYSRKIYE